MSDETDWKAQAWQRCPFGMVMVGAAGRIVGVNPALIRLVGTDVTGESEADFARRLETLPLEQQRLEVDAAGLRAIYYLGPRHDAAEALQRLGEVSEALRDPLSSIFGFAELLLTQHYDDMMRHELLTTMLVQMEEMNNVINRQLDLKSLV